ncbi:hypothetical protein NSMS1_18710 [Nostoc sp. MS1]|nr:hypothetical protein NSMS1_18710 [Nostoc sp. MS1]
MLLEVVIISNLANHRAIFRGDHGQVPILHDDSNRNNVLGDSNACNKVYDNSAVYNDDFLRAVCDNVVYSIDVQAKSLC